MLQRLKYLLINTLLYFKPCRWKNDGQVKVLISVNEYFTPKSWEKNLAKELGRDGRIWDIVFCDDKIDMFNHFESADVCFLFGFGHYLKGKCPRNKLLYFPTTGIEFLENTKLDDSTQVQRPILNNGHAIAEYTFAMAIFLTRSLYRAVFNQFSNKWIQKDHISNFKPISDYKIGVMGLGDIGQSIAGYFSKNGCSVYGISKTEKLSMNFLVKCFDSNALEAFLNVIDILIIALPLTEKTKNIIGLNELKQLGPSKYLINISRGGVVKEDDLLYALKHSLIKGAASDVFKREPLPPRSPFYKLKNFIITPHISGNINCFVNDIQDDFIRKSLQYIKNV